MSFTGTNVASSGGISLGILTRGLGRGSLGTGILHNLGITKTRSNTLTHLRESLRRVPFVSIRWAELNVARVTEKKSRSLLSWQNLVMSYDWGFTGDAPSKATWWCHTRSLSQWGWQIVLVLKIFAAPLWDAAPWRRLSCALSVGIPWRRAWQPTLVSCLENPIDGGAWRAVVYRVARSRTRLKQLSMRAQMLCW